MTGRLSRHDKMIFFAKVFKKYYPRGTTLETVFLDSRQPYKSKKSVQVILDEMVQNDMLVKVALTATGSFRGAPPLYVLADGFEIPAKVCPTCGQDMPEEEI